MWGSSKGHVLFLDDRLLLVHRIIIAIRAHESHGSNWQGRAVRILLRLRNSMWRYNHRLKIVRRLPDVRDEQKVMENGLRDVNLMSLSYQSNQTALSTAKP